jgi:NAD-dependent deacetylase
MTSRNAHIETSEWAATVEQVRERLRVARSVVVLSGAGVSAESGLSTFRSADGHWRKHRPEELATESAFRTNPALVQSWYRSRREQAAGARPNDGHAALVLLEQRMERFLLATQNVDGLHTRAGSRNVVELHGSIDREYCIDCGRAASNASEDGDELRRCDACSGLLRPGVVWFGESVPADAFERAYEAAAGADVFLSVGTSSIVYPAAGLPLAAKDAGAYVVEINVAPSAIADRMDAVLLGPAARVLPLLVPETGSGEAAYNGSPVGEQITI